MEPAAEAVERDVTLAVLLPGGQQGEATVHGSKPVMDLLVTLCAQHHLNPSDHTMELVSTNQNQIPFKPSSMIGSLEAERVVLKPKVADDRNQRRPHMPEATVRLLINYRKSHKAVVRVNPRVPLGQLLPAMCDKCEFDPETTVLLRTSQSEQLLDLTRTLNDYALRELYAKDTKVVVVRPPEEAPTHQAPEKDDNQPNKEKSLKEKENRGFLSLFRRSKKERQQGGSVSAPASPGGSRNGLSGHAGTASPSDGSKKRRAPLPPMMASQSYPCNLNSGQAGTWPVGTAQGQQTVFSRVSSTESSLKRTKRRAPPPPMALPSASPVANTTHDSSPTDCASPEGRD